MNEYEGKKTYDYDSESYKVENMNAGTYSNSGFTFSE